MESSSDYKISNSSLLSLKAEVLRKQQEINDAKNQVKLKQHAILKSRLKTSNILPKNKGVEDRQAIDEIEDEEILEKSKRMLESKAKLYNKLMKEPENFTEEETERNKQFLVQFDKKRAYDKPDSESEEERHFSDEYEPASNPDDEWIEYTDCLGRTRKCLRQDLDFIKKKDLELSRTLDRDDRRRENSEVRWCEDREGTGQSPEKENIENECVGLTEDNELLSNDMRRELMRREWEKQEQELMDKKNIHYQDILFNEARTHGVGYYAFSTDDEQRAKQQEELQKLRQETSKKQQSAVEQKQLREKQLAARLKAARNRKRARVGLPPEEDEPERPATEPEVEDNKEEDAKNLQKEQEEKEKEKKRNRHVRPWDIGKEGVKKTHYEYSQEEWVDKKRAERIEEFAPPSMLCASGSRHEIPYEEFEESSKLLYFTSKKKKMTDKNSEFVVDTSIPPPNFKQKITSINPYRNHSSDEESYNIEPPVTFKPTPIIDECVDFDDEQGQLKRDRTDLSSESSDSSDDNNRGKRAEIAPPATFDYYNSAKPGKLPKAMSNQNLEESIAAGLKYLRELSEKKEQNAKRRNLS